MTFKKIFIYAIGFLAIIQLSLLGMYRVPANRVLPIQARESTVATQQAPAIPLAQFNPELMQQAAAQVTAQSQPWTNQQLAGSFKATRPNLFRATSARLMTQNEASNILGLKGGESEAEIKNAYRKAALTAHPDAGGSNEKMKLVNQARDVLSGTTSSADSSQAAASSGFSYDTDGFSGDDFYEWERESWWWNKAKQWKKKFYKQQPQELLMEAIAKRQQLEALKILDMRNSDGSLVVDLNAIINNFTALTLAIRSRQEVIALKILDMKNSDGSSVVDLNFQDRDDCWPDELHYTALMWAIHLKQDVVALKILDVKNPDGSLAVDLNIADCWDDHTALMFAIRKEREAVALKILDIKNPDGSLVVDLNAKDRNGDTALTLAIRHKQDAVIEKLVSLGADALLSREAS